MNHPGDEDVGVLGNQSLRRPLTAAERRLATALVGCFAGGQHDFDAVAAFLQQQQIPRPSGTQEPWSVEALHWELKQINASLDQAYLGVGAKPATE